VAQAHADAQRFVVEGRVAGEKVRAEILEQAHREQQQVLDRARQEIESERQQAMVELRRDAVNLAVRGASKVIEKNLDDETNRKVVESFLALQQPTIARNYAETLVELARRASDLDGWGGLIDEVAGAIEADIRLARFLESPRVSADRKNEIVAAAFADRLPRPFVRFL